MKIKILIPSILLLCNSCAIKQSEYYSIASHVDYRQYTEKGFFLTEANSVSFDYTPISSVSSIERSGYVKKADKLESNNKDDVYNKNSKQSTLKIANAKGALEALYNEASKLGANGIINLKIINSTEKGLNEFGQQVDLLVISASGMAIKK